MAVTVFTVQGATIESVPEFKYLPRTMWNNDSDDPTVNRNLKEARTSWGLEVIIPRR
jgi:hypothetical protein